MAKKFIIIYLFWLVSHLIFLIAGMGGAHKGYFWPVKRYSYEVKFNREMTLKERRDWYPGKRGYLSPWENIRQTYGLTEFLVYTGLPLILFFAYRRLKPREQYVAEGVSPQA